ncbi:hypothetical protein SPHINGO8AM_70209 [Sphingomonas sp. 8AM]|nr:hypothetical protein SPHINGO8AM_70209 [Sphingomonas sp. 8AM]
MFIGMPLNEAAYSVFTPGRQNLLYLCAGRVSLRQGLVAGLHDPDRVGCYRRGDARVLASWIAGILLQQHVFDQA